MFCLAKRVFGVFFHSSELCERIGGQSYLHLDVFHGNWFGHCFHAKEVFKTVNVFKNK